MGDNADDAYVASEFRPHSPIAFWIAVLALVYAFASGAIAMSRIDECRELHGSSSQHWSYWPPGWVCDG